jgi:hypothetical protein
MDINDPVLVVAAFSLGAAALAMVASRLIGVATDQVAAELSDPDPELSRIRPKRR